MSSGSLPPSGRQAETQWPRPGGDEAVVVAPRADDVLGEMRAGADREGYGFGFWRGERGRHARAGSISRGDERLGLWGRC